MKNYVFILVIMVLVLLAGCAPFPKPNEVVVPTPVQGNSGRFLCPYTSDGTVTAWANKSIGAAASVGSAIGSYAGRKAGQKAAEQVPCVGGHLGQAIGDAAGREVALALVGGREFMRETSDLSFNTIDDLIVYTYAMYSNNEYWPQVKDITSKVYPAFERNWDQAIRKARKPR